MKTQLLNLKSEQVLNYDPVTKTHNGSDHMIVPVIMMVEGVHSGSQGPILYTTEELAKFVEAWNGTPVVINHPTLEDGTPVSANEPDVAERETIGRIYNARMDGDRLRGEAWLNEVTLKELSEETYEAVKNGRPMDVSIGVFSDREDVEGEFNGERYIGISHNARPDHLALLPNASGACSWDDGCGLRNNESSIINSMKKDGKKVTLEERGAWLTINGVTTPLLDSSELFNNEIGFREIGMSIQQKIDSYDSNSMYHILEEVFVDHFIYRASNMQNNTSEFYKRSYQINDEGQVEVSDDSTAVLKKVSYEAINNEGTTGAIKRTKFNNSLIKTKSRMNKNPEGSPCKVTALIENKATSYTEADREWLSTFEDAVLDKMAPIEVAPVVVNKEVQVPAKVTEAQIKEILANQEDPNSFIDSFMPAGMRDQMKSGLAMYQSKRTALIAGIVANSKFTEEHLKGWDTSDLETMSESLKVEENDFSVNTVTNSAPALQATEEMKSMLNLKDDK